MTTQASISIDQEQKTVAAQEEKIKKLTEVLKKYGNHLGNCAYMTGRSTRCTCNFHEALRHADVSLD